MEPINGYFKPVSKDRPARVMPLVWVELESRHGAVEYPFQALIDTGCTGCLFSAGIRDALSLRRVRPAFKRKVLDAQGGCCTASFYEIKLTFRNELHSGELAPPTVSYWTNVGFVTGKAFNSNLGGKRYLGYLGQVGFLDQFSEIAFMRRKGMFQLR